jgi:peptide-methionine (S)-S-oxide reductase
MTNFSLNHRVLARLRRIVPVVLGLTFVGAACAGSQAADSQSSQAEQAAQEEPAVAVFAGGCFWCVEEAFDKVDGVISTTSGYIGGRIENPTYKQVSAGGTGHAEAVRVVYDPDRVSYGKLVQTLWLNIDPLTPDAQFCDHGDQYRSAIFYTDDAQRRVAEESKRRIEASGRFNTPIATEIVPAGAFYAAEDYHQDYHNKNPTRYRFYKWNCGRAQRLEALWGDAAGGVDVTG